MPLLLLFNSDYEVTHDSRLFSNCFKHFLVHILNKIKSSLLKLNGIDLNSC